MKTVTYQAIRDEAKQLYESYITNGDNSGPSFYMCLEYIFETYLADGFAVINEMEVCI